MVSKEYFSIIDILGMSDLPEDWEAEKLKEVKDLLYDYCTGQNSKDRIITLLIVIAANSAANKTPFSEDDIFNDLNENQTDFLTNLSISFFIMGYLKSSYINYLELEKK